MVPHGSVGRLPGRDREYGWSHGLPQLGELDAARRAVANPIARQVKLADVADNMDLERIPNPTARDYARLEEYKQVYALLLDGPED